MNNLDWAERHLTESERRWISNQARAIVELDGRRVTPRGEWLSEQVVLGFITTQEAKECILEDVLLIQIRQIREAKNRVLEK